MRHFEDFLTEEKLENWGYEAKVQKLNGLLWQIGEKYKNGSEKIAKLPIDSSCRIMMDSFRKIYGEDEVAADENIVRSKEKMWAERQKEWSEEERRENKIGEQFEALKTAVFNKFLGDRFIVVRSSLYDDYKNGVDNVMVDIKSGNVVCAFDEVGDDSFYRRQKEQKIFEKNLVDGGASLKYAFTFKNGKVIASRLDNLPVFCLHLSADKIREGVLNMNFSLGRKSEAESQMFGIFMDELASQADALDKKLSEAIADSKGEKAGQLRELKERLGAFKEAMFASKIQSGQSQKE